jgi:transcriptional regulator with XRE-family HTH domain
MGMTQQQLAEMLNTTQQTIARWESGKTPIPSTLLKDLAIILSCTIEDVLGTAITKRGMYARSMTSSLKTKEKLVGLYGGLELGFSSFEEQFEFSIDEEVCQFLSRFFEDAPGKSKLDWLFVETMDNWRLFINLRALTCLETYDDDAVQAPRFDHPEVYKALTGSSNLEEQELSDTLLKYCQEKISEYDAEDSEALWDYYNTAQIYTKSGKSHTVFLDEKNAWRLHEFEITFDGLESDFPYFLRFENESTGGIEIFNVHQIEFIKVPAAAYRAATASDEEDVVENVEN